MTTPALIDPSTLKAARARAGLELGELAERLGVSGGAERVRTWETGEARPSFAQARKLSAILRVPFAALFMPPAALGPSELPDLRTVGARRRTFSLDLLEVYDDALRKQAWVREVREERGFEAVAFVGAAPAPGTVSDAGVSAGAAAILKLLELQPSDRQAARDQDAFLSLLVRRAEDAGVLVLRSSTVGANTHRGLSVEEFRGFAIADAFAPLVFINTADAKTAQAFTLIHELAHLWRAETGISQPSLEAPKHVAVDAESICDAIAAEVLVPARHLEAAWQPREPLAPNADRLRRSFKVSGLVIARRALDLGLVSRRAYTPYVAEQLRLSSVRKPASTSGPPFALMVAMRNGATVTDMVGRALRGGEILWRDAGNLLGVSPSTLAQLTSYQGFAG